MNTKLYTFVGLGSAVALLIVFAFGNTNKKNKVKKPPAPDLSIPEYEKKDIICFALYTVSNSTLKLTAQLYPLDEEDSRIVRLEIEKNGKWQEIAKTQVIEDGWTAPFKVTNWDDSRRQTYRVVHGKDATYQGVIRSNPKDKEELIIAGFTGNSIRNQHGGDLSKQDLIDNVKRIDADLLFFSGDQVYNHFKHYQAWLKFGRDFGEIIRDRPTICLPDDHDVGQPNLWGESGKISTIRGNADGGYARPANYVIAAERAQTSHLPDPVDPHKIGQGIGVWFTNLNWGNVDFAILEDRKFKTGPAGKVPKMGPRPDHINDPNYDPTKIDIDGAKLLGERQLKFIDKWTADWNQARMKVALSATIFCGGAHIHGAANGRLHADMDSNGWPQSGRNRALKSLRKGFTFHLAGDQHLATIFQYGVEQHRDAGFSFCVPSIANLYLRWWDPLEAGKNRQENAPEYTGDHLDGFQNKVTNFAAANPEKHPAGNVLNTRAAGFGVVRLNTRKRTIKMECWPRNIDITAPNAQQYKGWPKTISQFDNYCPPSWESMGTITFNVENPVVQLIDTESKEVLYTVRAHGSSFTPKAPIGKSFTIKAGINGPNKVISENTKTSGINISAKL